jgi:hypothetical protein
MIGVVIGVQFAVFVPSVGLFGIGTLATMPIRVPAEQGAMVVVVVGRAATSARLVNFVLASRRDGGVCMPIFLITHSNSPCLTGLLEAEAQALDPGSPIQHRCGDGFIPLSVIVLDEDRISKSVKPAVQAKRLKPLLFGVVPKLIQWIMYMDIDIIPSGPLGGLVGAAMTDSCRAAGWCLFKQPARPGATFSQSNPEPFHTGVMFMWRNQKIAGGAPSKGASRQRGRGGLAPDDCAALPDLRGLGGAENGSDLAEIYTAWLVACLPGSSVRRIARQVVMHPAPHPDELFGSKGGRSPGAISPHEPAPQACWSAWYHLIVSGQFDRDQAALGHLVEQGICSPKILPETVAVPVVGRWQLASSKQSGVPSIWDAATVLRFKGQSRDTSAAASLHGFRTTPAVVEASLGFPDLWVHWPSWRQWWMQGRDVDLAFRRVNQEDATPAQRASVASRACLCSIPAQPRGLPLLLHLTNFRLRTMPISTRRAWQRALRLPLLPDRHDTGACPAGPGATLLESCAPGCPWFLQSQLAREAFDTGIFEGTESLPFAVRPVVAGARVAFSLFDWVSEAREFLDTIQ